MMKRFATYILLLLCSVTLWAKPYSAQTLPELDRYTRVSNPDGILSQNAVDSIHSMLRALDAHNVFCIVAVVKNIEDDEMVLEFVTPTQLMEEKRMDDERYITSVARKVYEEELQGMSAKEFFRLLRDWELDELIFPHLNYLEFMDAVKERLVTYYE